MLSISVSTAISKRLLCTINYASA